MATRVLGVDRALGGWVGVALDDGAHAGVTFARALADLVAAHPGSVAVGIDIPIGLPDAAPRRADLAARERIGARRHSVFLTPPRAVLEAATHAEAVRRSRALTGAGVSIQAYGLRAAIGEAERAIAAGVPLHEVHPEVTFRELAGTELAWAKKTWNGQAQRRALLGDVGILLPHALPPVAGRVPVDDVLDAAAVAWTAHRIATGRAARLPADAGPGEPVIWI